MTDVLIIKLVNNFQAKYQSRCSVYAVKDIIGPLNKNQQYTVIKLGFGNLIRVKAFYITYELCSWLIDSYDIDNKELHILFF